MGGRTGGNGKGGEGDVLLRQWGIKRRGRKRRRDEERGKEEFCAVVIVFF